VTAARRLAVALVLLAAAVLQPTVVARLQLPLGAPQLVLAVLAVLALVEGPLVGAVGGFSVGLLSDLLSDHAVGRDALVLTLVGYVTGLVRDEGDRSALVPLAAVAASTAAALLLAAAASAVFGEARAGARGLLTATAGAVLYNVLLTPFLFPALRALLTRLDPERAT